MSLPALVDAAGRAFALGRSLASGGEGTVYELPRNAERVAKLYRTPPGAATVEKLRVLTQLASRVRGNLAWPAELLHDAKTRQVVGFVMPRVRDCEPLQHLYNPIQRLRVFPRAGWRFQVQAACNLAAAFDEVHQAGCLVGDVNQSNVLVDARALVWLIDCDSFQVRAGGGVYPCEVGVPHYTPPELQGRSFRGLERIENHDRSGLAVLIYQLLFVGRHPYAGVYRGAGDPSFDQLIAEYRFAQGPRAASWDMAPPPHTPQLADLPDAVAGLFCQAFERGSERDARPRASEWVQRLEALDREIVPCKADAGHQHWRGAKGCVWCRLAAKGGPEYYFGNTGTAEPFVLDEKRLRAVEKQLAACEPNAFTYQRRDYAPTEAPLPQPLPEIDNIELSRADATATLLAALIAIVCFLSSCCLFFFTIIGGCSVVSLGALGAIYFGVRIASMGRKLGERRRERLLQEAWREEAFDTAQGVLAGLEGQWDQAVRSYLAAHRQRVAAAKSALANARSLPQQYREELARIQARTKAEALKRHLGLHWIADAQIEQIGTKRKQDLADAGILTAADITEAAVRNVRGFGDKMTRNLLAWQAAIHASFTFDERTAIAPGHARLLTQTYTARCETLIGQATAELATLPGLANTCRQQLKQLGPRLREAVAAYEQARADVGLLSRS